MRRFGCRVSGADPCPAFWRSEINDPDNGEVRSALLRRKPPAIFCRNFIIRPSRSAKLLVNGTLGSVRKRSTVRFARAEPQQQIVADPAWRWAAWRVAFVKAGCAV